MKQVERERRATTGSHEHLTTPTTYVTDEHGLPVADESIERATREHLADLGHDVAWGGDVEQLGLGAVDEDVAR